MQVSDAHATIRAALEEYTHFLAEDEKPPIIEAIAWLDTLAAGQYQPIEGHIIMCMSGEIQDVQAHSISGLPLPEGVAVCKMIGDSDA